MCVCAVTTIHTNIYKYYSSQGSYLLIHASQMKNHMGTAICMISMRTANQERRPQPASGTFPIETSAQVLQRQISHKKVLFMTFAPVIGPES